MVENSSIVIDFCSAQINVGDNRRPLGKLITGSLYRSHRNNHENGCFSQINLPGWPTVQNKMYDFQFPFKIIYIGKSAQ